MTCVSEQGKNGLLWTVFEGEPFCSRRIASFSNDSDAREYLLLKQGHTGSMVEILTIEKLRTCEAALLAVARAAAYDDAEGRPHGGMGNPQFPDGCECHLCEQWDSRHKALTAAIQSGVELEGV